VFFATEHVPYFVQHKTIQ